MVAYAWVNRYCIDQAIRLCFAGQRSLHLVDPGKGPLVHLAGVILWVPSGGAVYQGDFVVWMGEVLLHKAISTKKVTNIGLKLNPQRSERNYHFYLFLGGQLTVIKPDF